MRRASQAQREKLADTFLSLCRIESPSGRERACADWVAAELRSLGLEPEEDEAGEVAGSDAGNLLAYLPGQLFQRALEFRLQLTRASKDGMQGKKGEDIIAAGID